MMGDESRIISVKHSSSSTTRCAITRCNTCHIILAESSMRNHCNSEIHKAVLHSCANNELEYNNNGWCCLICDGTHIPISDFNRILKKHFESDDHINRTLRNTTSNQREITTTTGNKGNNSSSSDINNKSISNIVINNHVMSSSISDSVELKRVQNNEIIDLVKDLIEIKTLLVTKIEKVIDDVIKDNFMSKLNVRPFVELTGLDILADIVATDNQHSMPSKKQRR